MLIWLAETGHVLNVEPTPRAAIACVDSSRFGARALSLQLLSSTSAKTGVRNRVDLDIRCSRAIRLVDTEGEAFCERSPSVLTERLSEVTAVKALESG